MVYRRHRQRPVSGVLDVVERGAVRQMTSNQLDEGAEEHAVLRLSLKMTCPIKQHHRVRAFLQAES